VDALRGDMREVKGRLGILESQYAHIFVRIGPSPRHRGTACRHHLAVIASL